MPSRLVTRRRTAAPWIGAVVVFSFGCSSGTPAADTSAASRPSPTEAPATTESTAPSARDEGWTADLAQLVPSMSAIHPDLFHGVPEAEVAGAVADLIAGVPTATDDELMVGVLRTVALFSGAGCEGHTGAFVWGAGQFPVDSMPLRVWLFGDDLVVVDALAPYESLIGQRIDSIEGQPTGDVVAAIAPLVPHDNEETIRLVTPRLVLIPQVLQGLGLADDGSLSLTVTPADSAPGVEGEAVTVDPISMADYNAWAGVYGLHLPADPSVRYLSRIDDALWWELLPDGRTLFVQYNRVDRLPASEVTELRAALADVAIERIVLDVRHNFGGELSALEPIVGAFADAAATRPGGLFVVTGRNTFSAGSLLVARLDDETDAAIVGESMGGCPTTWGNPEEVTLPYSGLVVSVAHDLSVGVAADDDRLTIEPDVPAVLTVQQWIDGVDPALAAIEGAV